MELLIILIVVAACIACLVATYRLIKRAKGE